MIKKNKMKRSLKIIFSATLFVVLFGSCKKDLLDINVDPNNPTTASANAGLVLPAALATTANIYNNPSADSRFAFAGLWLGHIGYSGNYAIATENVSYALTNSFGGSAAFNTLYDNIEDYDFVEQKGAEQKNSFYQAIGILMKAYNFQTLVDLFNNVPYTQALKGTGNSKPAYDNGKAIYEDLAKRMDTAIKIFKTSAAGNTITGDILFGGDVTKWLQFANTVKLRLLLRQSQVNGAAAQTQAAAIAGGFLTTDAAVQPGYLNSAGKQNPFFGANINVAGTYTNDFYRAGQYNVAFLKANNDPRIGSFYKPVLGTTTFQGNFFGEQGLSNSKTSEFGPGVLKAFSQPAVIMLAAESYFLQSEAALRGWITGDPKTLYEGGVVASFIYLGANYAPIRNTANTNDSITFTSTTSAQKYFSQAGNKQTTFDATTTFQEKLAVIIRQKYEALTLINELQPYNDYRRLRLPADIPLSFSLQSTGAIPNRLLYPQREYEVNPENVQAQGTVKPTDKVWWMP